MEEFKDKIIQVVINKLLFYMNKQNLTQYKLAINSGVPFSTIKHIMQRKTKDIKLSTLIQLASGLGIKPSQLIDDKIFMEF